MPAPNNDFCENGMDPDDCKLQIEEDFDRQLEEAYNMLDRLAEYALLFQRLEAEGIKPICGETEYTLHDLYLHDEHF